MFNSSDFTTLEVKFTQSDILEESKKRALETYDENNKCLGLIFSTDIEKYSENSDLDEECLPDIHPFNLSYEISEVTNSFKEVLTHLKNSEISKAEDLGKNLGLFNSDHPSISFLPRNQAKRREKLSQTKNQLPWTSADSITIFPL